jgi:hypothetical protein
MPTRPDKLVVYHTIISLLDIIHRPVFIQKQRFRDWIGNIPINYVCQKCSSEPVLFSTYDGSQNRHARDLKSYTGLFFHKFAYSRYDIPSDMFQTDNTKFYSSPLQELESGYLLSH